MAEIKAIETRYKGYRFRSRLEARWAVFFDAMAIRWEYEREGYELPSGLYLPDFWLDYSWCSHPGWGFWLELKGQDPIDGEKRLCRELAAHTGHVVYLIVGTPADVVRVWKWYRGGNPVRDGEAINLSACCFLGCSQADLGDPPWIVRPGLVTRGVTAARSARFEHGETPRA